MQQEITRDLSKHFNLCLFFGRRLSFIREKSDCKAIAFTAWGLGQSPDGLSGGKKPKNVCLFNIFKVNKWLTMALKKLYSWPKKLYQFITNLFLLVNISTSR